MLRLPAFALFGWLLVACGASNEAPSGPVLEPGPGAFAEDFATSGAFFTRMRERRKGLSSSPHGLVQIFYSNNLQPAVGGNPFDAPEGTVAIKAQDHDANGSVDTIQVMIKKSKGYDDFTHDWSFERRFADGTLEVADTPTLDFCHECHNGFTRTSELAGTALAN